MRRNCDICMIVHNSMTNDSRVHREATTLTKQGWSVTVIGVSLTNFSLPTMETTDEGYTIIRIIPAIGKNLPFQKIIKQIRLFISLFAIARKARQVNAQVYHGHDFMGLVSIAMAGVLKRPVIYNSHELYFDRRVPGKFRLQDLLQIVRPLEKPLARRAIRVITVNDSLADKLAETLNIQRPMVLRNAVDLRTLGECAAVFPKTTPFQIAHSGALTHGRHLPELVTALSHLPESISLILLGDGNLRSSLLDLAKSLNVQHRLHIIPPVPINSVSPTLAQADAAAVMIARDNPNCYYSLPNKFFEAIAGGVPIVTSPIPEVSKYVKQYDIGVVSEDTDPLSIAHAIEHVLHPDYRDTYRQNVKIAQQEFNWEREEVKLIDLYRGLIASP